MAKIEVKIADEQELARWDFIVDDRETGTVFHRLDWLRAIEKESRTHFVPVIGYKGGEIIFVLPLFFKNYFGFKAALSPPPGCLIPELGFVSSIKVSKINVAEKRHIEALDACVDFIRKKFRPDLVNISNPVGLDDVRPFIWNHYKVRPFYTYHINLFEDEDAIFSNLRSQVRTDIKRAKKYSDLEIVNGDFTDFIEIINNVRNRYARQNKRLAASDEYFCDIYKAFGDRHIQVKTIVSNHRVLTGLVLIRNKNKVMHWIGGIAPIDKRIGLNELLHWEVIKEYKKNNFAAYDLVGANTRHLCWYKSKLGPELKVHFGVEKQNFKGNFFRAAYGLRKKLQMFRDSRSGNAD